MKFVIVSFLIITETCAIDTSKYSLVKMFNYLSMFCLNLPVAEICKMTNQCWNTWRWCPTYGRNILSYCYVSATSVDHPGWPAVVSSWNVCSVAYLVLSASKGAVVILGLTQSVATSCLKNGAIAPFNGKNQWIKNKVGTYGGGFLHFTTEVIFPWEPRCIQV